MHDLRDRLKDAIEQRLAVAREAAGHAPQWMVTVVEPYTDPVLLGTSDGETYAVVGSVDVDVPVQAHIATNSPDVVIRQCLADLRRLERHHPRWLDDIEMVVCDCCGWDLNADGEGEPTDICPDVADLLDVYALTPVPAPAETTEATEQVIDV